MENLRDPLNRRHAKGTRVLVVRKKQFWRLRDVVVELVIDLSMHIKNGSANLVGGPGDTGKVRIRNVPSRKNLVSIAVWPQEINCGTASNTVPGRSKVDLDTVASQYIARA